MKIVIATAVYYPMINGVAVFSHNLAIGLTKRGNEVMVICPSQTGRNYTRMIDDIKMVYLKSVSAKVYPDQIHAVPAKKKVFGVEWPHLWYRHGFRVSIFPQREVRKALDEFQPDVVHIQVSDPIGLSVAGYARKHGIPIVTTEHNQPEVITEPLHVPGLMKKPVDAALTAYFVNRQSKSDFVTMPTTQAIDNLIWSRGKDFAVPVAAVSNGVDLSNFRPGKAPDELYEKYKLNKNYKTLLSLGRVDPEKNVGLVIDAFIKVKRQLSGVQLVIVGDGVDKARLEKKVAKYDDIHFLGRIVPPELYKVYQLGDVFVTASEIETQGIVLIEAAACGLPIIAVDKGAVKEVCITGENGYLCRPGDVNEISEAMVKILTNDKKYKEFSRNSLAIAAEHNFEKTLDKFINIYNKVIENKK